MIGGDPFITLGPAAVVFLAALLAIYALLGKPLFAIIASATMLFYLSSDPPYDLTSMFTEMSVIAREPLFVTVPLFVLAGTLLSESGAPVRLVEVVRGFFGWMPGGLAIVTTVSCALFTSFTGASGITIVALGGILYPMLRREGYPHGFSLGLITTGGSLGLLFPPSLPIIIYGLIAKEDIDRLFVAGFVPGLVLVGACIAYSIWTGVRARVPRHPFVWSTAWRAALRAAPELPIPVIVIAGIYTGKITPSQAAAVTAFYVLFVECVIYRDIRPRELPRVMRKTAELVGAIIVILGMALGLTNYLVNEGIAQRLVGLIAGRIENEFQFLLLLNGFLLVAGSLLEGFSAILVLVPLILPLAADPKVRLAPLHLGIIFLTNLEIGFLMPPVGLNLFLSSLRFRRPVLEVARHVLPFLAIMLACLALITYVPWFSMWLPGLLGKLQAAAHAAPK
jgi:tripartite ATP-independent transporter DctM subunit